MFSNPRAEGQCKWRMEPERFLMTAETPPLKKTDYVKRHVVEFCRGPGSKIGNKTYFRDGCSVTRITEDDDVTTPQGLRKALGAVKQENCTLWVSMPCTGGSPWQHIHANRPGGTARVKEHKQKFANI